MFKLSAVSGKTIGKKGSKREKAMIGNEKVVTIELVTTLLLLNQSVINLYELLNYAVKALLT
jgi:hypothetical protein